MEGTDDVRGFTNTAGGHATLPDSGKLLCIPDGDLNFYYCTIDYSNLLFYRDIQICFDKGEGEIEERSTTQFSGGEGVSVLLTHTFSLGFSDSFDVT